MNIFVDEQMPLKEALVAITDEWVDNGEFCHQTILDLRDACIALERERDELRREVERLKAAMDHWAHNLETSKCTWRSTIAKGLRTAMDAPSDGESDGEVLTCPMCRKQFPRSAGYDTRTFVWCSRECHEALMTAGDSEEGGTA